MPMKLTHFATQASNRNAWQGLTCSPRGLAVTPLASKVNSPILPISTLKLMAMAILSHRENGVKSAICDQMPTMVKIW